MDAGIEDELPRSEYICCPDEDACQGPSLCWCYEEEDSDES